MKMNKEHIVCIMLLMVNFVIVGSTIAADKVVVVPINHSTDNGQYVSAENSYLWNSASGGVMSKSVRAECPSDCIAVNGACSEKTVGDQTKVTITGANFSKSGSELLYFNAYTCWMYAPHDSTNPPVGYAQVICYCE